MCFTHGVEHDPVQTTADVLCLMETRNSGNMHVNGFVSVHTIEAEHPAGIVGICVKLPHATENLMLPMISQCQNREHPAAKLTSAIAVMAMYLASNLLEGDVTKNTEKAMH